MSPPLAVTSATTGSTAVLTLTGDLDFINVARLKAEVSAVVVAPVTRLIIDLSGVAICDSTGFGALIWSMRHATGHGCWLLLCGPRTRVRQIIEMAGLDTVIPVVDTIEEAHAAAVPP
jgi:anti-sigma B factor antagonist